MHNIWENLPCQLILQLSLGLCGHCFPQTHVCLFKWNLSHHLLKHPAWSHNEAEILLNATSGFNNLKVVFPLRAICKKSYGSPQREGKCLLQYWIKSYRSTVWAVFLLSLFHHLYSVSYVVFKIRYSPVIFLAYRESAPLKSIFKVTDKQIAISS